MSETPQPFIETNKQSGAAAGNRSSVTATSYIETNKALRGYSVRKQSTVHGFTHCLNFNKTFTGRFKLGDFKESAFNFCLKVQFPECETFVLLLNTERFDSNSVNITIPVCKRKKKLENFAQKFSFFSTFTP